MTRAARIGTASTLACFFALLVKTTESAFSTDDILSSTTDQPYTTANSSTGFLATDAVPATTFTRPTNLQECFEQCKMNDTVDSTFKLSHSCYKRQSSSVWSEAKKLFAWDTKHNFQACIDAAPNDSYEYICDLIERLASEYPCANQQCRYGDLQAAWNETIRECAGREYCEDKFYETAKARLDTFQYLLWTNAQREYFHKLIANRSCIDYAAAAPRGAISCVLFLFIAVVELNNQVL